MISHYHHGDTIIIITWANDVWLVVAMVVLLWMFVGKQRVFAKPEERRMRFAEFLEAFLMGDDWTGQDTWPPQGAVPYLSHQVMTLEGWFGGSGNSSSSSSSSSSSNCC